MRYKLLSQLLITAALSGALTLSAAPQANKLNNQDPGAVPDVQPTTVVDVRSLMSDHRIERKLHKEIARDVTMSNRALDVRIIAKNGQVTLKGSVPTTMEKDKIEAKAADLVGSNNVVDRIKVKHHNYLG